MQLTASERWSDTVSSEAFPGRVSSSIVMDEEEGDEEEDEKTLSTMPSITPSMVKEGLSFAGATLNGSDVRVGILMARWNADIVQGLHKVIL